MDERIEKLEHIATSFKKNNKLSKKNEKEVNDNVAKMLLNPDTLGRGLEFVHIFPPKQAGESFGIALKNGEIPECEAMIDSIISSKKFENLPGYKRLTVIIKQIIPFSEELAVKLLTYLSISATESATKIPSTQLLDVFWNHLMLENDLGNIFLGNKEITTKELNALTIMVIGGLFVRGAPEANRVKYYVHWLDKGKRKISPAAIITSKFENYLSKLPGDVQRLCLEKGLIRKTKDNLNESTSIMVDTGFIEKNALTPGLEERDYETSAGDNLQSSAEGLPEKDITAARDERAGFETYLGAIRSYIIELEKEYYSQQRRFNDAETQLKIEKNKKASFESKYKEVEELLEKKDKENQAFRDNINDLNKKVEELESKLKDLEDQKKGEINDLLEKIKSESEFAKDEVKNVIAQSLQRYFDDLTKIEEEQMSEQLFEHLKYLNNKIFSVLIDKGVPLNRG